jgi:hypothetical protein
MSLPGAHAIVEPSTHRAKPGFAAGFLLVLAASASVLAAESGADRFRPLSRLIAEWTGLCGGRSQYRHNYPQVRLHHGWPFRQRGEHGGISRLAFARYGE